MKIFNTVAGKTLAGAIFTAALSVPGTASAATVVVGFRLDNINMYDYAAPNYSSGPSGGVGTISFDNSVMQVQDYGNLVFTYFYGGAAFPFGTAFASPITSLIPRDPYSGAYGSFYDSYTSPYTQQQGSPAGLLESFAAQANTFSLVDGTYSAYHIELRTDKYVSAADGVDLQPFAFTPTSLDDFIEGFVTSGNQVYFAESYQVYTLQDGVAVYSDGKNWSGLATLTSLSVSGVPEPGTWVILMLGFFSLGIALRRNAHLTARRTAAIGKV